MKGRGREEASRRACKHQVSIELADHIVYHNKIKTSSCQICTDAFYHPCAGSHNEFHLVTIYAFWSRHLVTGRGNDSWTYFMDQRLDIYSKVSATGRVCGGVVAALAQGGHDSNFTL